MNLEDEMKKVNLEYEFDSNIQMAIRDFFRIKPNCSMDELSSFVNYMITDICRQFANNTESQMPKARIEEFNKKIYTIMKDSKIQVLTAEDKGKELYGKLFEFIQCEQFPTGKEYSPEKDKRLEMSETELSNRDYDIRKKYLEHLIDTYGLNMPIDLSTYMVTLNDHFQNNPENMNDLSFGRMNMQNAAFMKRVIYDLGYKVNLDELLVGKTVKLDKVQSANEKSIVEQGETQKDLCFSNEEMAKMQDYFETLDGVEKYFWQVTGMKQYDEFGFVVGQEESKTPITDAMRAWGEEEKESETPITDAMRAWGEEEKESETPITDAMRAWGEEEKESETPITDAMRAWEEEEKESETPITDAMMAMDEERKESKKTILDKMRSQLMKKIGSDPWVNALVNKLVESGEISIPYQPLKVQQGDFEKVATILSEVSIKSGCRDLSLEGAYGRRNIKKGQIQKANQVIHESIQNKDVKQNEQEGGTDHDQH